MHTGTKDKTSTAIVNLENTALSTHNVSAGILTQYLTPERIQQCNTNLKEIDYITYYLTIENLNAQGQLTKVQTKLCNELRNCGINPELLTIEEASSVLSYINTATEDIETLKVEKIRDMISLVLNGIRNRRDYRLSDKKSKILEELLDKYIRYERGEIDFSRNFDYTVYPKDDNAAQPEESIYSNVYYSDDENYDEEDTFSAATYEKDRTSHPEFERFLNALSDEELLAGGYIEEEDFFRYGPFTLNDLNNLGSFLNETWSHATHEKDRPRLESLLGDIIRYSKNSVDRDLTYGYIAGLVLPARRPTVKNMIAIIGSLMKYSNKLIETKAAGATEETAKVITELKRQMQSCSYYATRVCGFSTADNKTKYKLMYPIVNEYADELLNKSDGWTRETEAQLEKDFGQYLNKLDDIVFEIEAACLKLNSKVSEHNAEEPKALPGLE